MADFPGGVVEHLRDAIRLNRSRRAGYVAVAGSRAATVSRLLVAAEVSLLPIAALLDRRARRFVASGISVIVGDLVSMRGAGSPEAPPKWRGVASGRDAARLRFAVRTTVSPARRSLKSGSFEDAADHLRDAVRAVVLVEEESGCHWALTVHVLESAASAARNASRWRAMSGGATARLSAQFVCGHLRLVAFAVRLDKLAQPVQAAGAGILVNDLPAIPPTDSSALAETD